MFALGLMVAFLADGFWGFALLIPYGAVVAAVMRMWISAIQDLGNLEHLLEQQEQIQRFLVLAAASMICCMIVLGGKMELARDGRDMSSGRKAEIPDRRTITWIRWLGLYWSILLIGAYIPTQVGISNAAKPILGKFPLDQVSPSGRSPSAYSADQIKTILEARKGIADALRLDFSLLSASSLLTLLAPLLSGVLSGFGKKE
jgi:hypothetical protein